jgi:uncharacterized protein with HEPN domain
MREQSDTAARTTSLGRASYDTDETVRLACEALVMRVGDLAKRLVALEPALATDPIWSYAARTRDTVAHHYHRIDLDALWETVSTSFPILSEAVDDLRTDDTLGNGIPSLLPDRSVRLDSLDFYAQ